MRKALLSLTVALLSGLVFVGCGGDSETTGETEEKTVTVIDGRVDGALVFADCDKDGKYSQGDRPAYSINGTATLEIPSTCDYDKIIAIMNNATDIDLGIKVNGALIAPANSTVVSPLTSLVSEQKVHLSTVVVLSSTYLAS
jgi:hypothetical protein